MFDSTDGLAIVLFNENFQRHCKHLLAAEIIWKQIPTDPEPNFTTFPATEAATDAENEEKEVKSTSITVNSWLLGPENCNLLVDLLPDDFAIDEGESEEETKSEVFSSEIDFKPDKKNQRSKKQLILMMKNFKWEEIQNKKHENSNPPKKNPKRKSKKSLIHQPKKKLPKKKWKIPRINATIAQKFQKIRQSRSAELVCPILTWITCQFFLNLPIMDR